MQWAVVNCAKPVNIYKSYEVVVRNRRIVIKLMEDQLHINREMFLRIMLQVSGKSKIYAKFVALILNVRAGTGEQNYHHGSQNSRIKTMFIFL
jgi:hypothetical protein